MENFDLKMFPTKYNFIRPGIELFENINIIVTKSFHVSSEWVKKLFDIFLKA